MNQPSLFDLPAPFAKGSHTSYLAALAQATQPVKRAWKTRVYLEVLAITPDGLTDHEAVQAMRAVGCYVLGVQSICSIRNAARNCGLVERGAIVPGPFGTPNARWVLTRAGRRVIQGSRA